MAFYLHRLSIKLVPTISRIQILAKLSVVMIICGPVVIDIDCQYVNSSEIFLNLLDKFCIKKRSENSVLNNNNRIQLVYFYTSQTLQIQFDTYCFSMKDVLLYVTGGKMTPETKQNSLWSNHTESELETMSQNRLVR